MLYHEDRPRTHSLSFSLASALSVIVNARIFHGIGREVEQLEADVYKLSRSSRI